MLIKYLITTLITGSLMASSPYSRENSVELHSYTEEQSHAAIHSTAYSNTLYPTDPLHKKYRPKTPQSAPIAVRPLEQKVPDFAIDIPLRPPTPVIPSPVAAPLGISHSDRIKIVAVSALSAIAGSSITFIAMWLSQADNCGK